MRTVREHPARFTDDTTVALTQVDYTDTSTVQVDGVSAICEGAVDQPFDKGSDAIGHAKAVKGEALHFPVINRASEKRMYALVVSETRRCRRRSRSPRRRRAVCNKWASVPGGTGSGTDEPDPGGGGTARSDPGHE